jgi:hypothetical protein
MILKYMTRDSNFGVAIALTILALLWVSPVLGQQLKVAQSKIISIDRATSNGVATIIIESAVPDLDISTTFDDTFLVSPGKGEILNYYLYVDPQKEIEMGFDACYRKIIIKSASSSEIEIQTPIIQPNQVIHYFVSLIEVFPITLSAEYVYSPTSRCGTRISFGGKYGGYLEYKWGKYIKAGDCIDGFDKDVDIGMAEELGFIRKSYLAGMRIGITKKIFPIYLFMGGGYGEYGRQWKNATKVGNSVYFYSDYLRGVDMEIGISATFWNYFNLSVGAEMLLSNGKISSDFLIGAGVVIPFTHPSVTTKIKK